MLPVWDKLQDLRKPRTELHLEPIPVATVPLPPGQAEVERITDKDVLDAGADRIVAARVLTTIARDRKMSLLGKLQHLTEEAQSFNDETGLALDGIAAKIALGREKRRAAEAKHHAYYDTIIGAVDESTKVIDRLSNGPLSGDGGS